MPWTPEAYALSKELAVALGQDVTHYEMPRAAARIEKFADWASAQGAGLEKEVQAMQQTEEEYQSPPWPEENKPPTVAVSVAMKINLGNYESADAFVSVSGLEAGASEEEIAALMDTGKLAWSVLTRALGSKVAAMRVGDVGPVHNAPPAPVQAQQPVQPPAPVPTGPFWIVGNDGIRSCSIHGVGKLVPAGVSKTGKAYNAFWACNNRDCKPTGA